MDLETRETAVCASRQKTGIQVVEMAAGKSLKIETTPAGFELLNVECPAGKSWVVQVQVTINEVDN